MKKRLVLTVAAASLLALVSCNQPATSSSSVAPTPSSDESSQSTTEGTITSVTVAAVGGQTTINKKGQVTVVAMVDGTGKFSQLVTWSSDNEAVATVDAKGVVTGIGGGTANIKATSKQDATKSASIAINVKARSDDYAVLSLADVLSDDKNNGENTFITTVKVSGYKSGATAFDSYGNIVVTDAAGANETIVYGATASSKALVFDATTETWAFKNAKDFLTNEYTKDIKIGDTLEVVAIRADYNSTKEISIVVIAVNGVNVINEGTQAAPLTTDEVQARDYQKNSMYLYYVQGVVTAWSGSATDGGKYGNFYIKSEGATGDALAVYGATAKAEGAFTYTATTGVTKFNNPQDFLTNEGTKDIKIGDTVTMYALKTAYNTTKEISGVIIPAIVPVDPVIEEETIDNLLTKTASDSKVFTVSGILDTIGGTYGNGTLTNPTTGKSITVYGLSSTEGDLALTDTKLGYYEGVFSNSQNCTSTAGQYITMEAVFKYFNGTPEISGILKKTVEITDAAYTYKFAVTKEDTTNGTFVVDKDADLTFGETVTITATPDSGYAIDSVKVVNAYGVATSAVADATDATKFTFTVSCVNKVEVAFAAEAAPTGDVTSDIAGNLSDFAISGTTDSVYTERKATINHAQITAVANISKTPTWTSNLLVLKKDAAATLTIESNYTFNKVVLNGFNWNTDASSLTMQYWDETTSAWVDDTATTSKFVATTSNPSEAVTLTTSTLSTKKVKVLNPGAKRVGFASVVITYPAA
jgi:hypothetical protein